MLKVVDNEGNVTNIVNVTDATKRLQKCFELKKLSQKKGTKPSIYLYKTPDCDRTKIFNLESWATLKERAWLPNGWSVIPCECEVDETVFKNTFKGGRRNRAQQFLDMKREDQANFLLLEATKQIGYLEVPHSVHAQFKRPDFGMENLLKYAGLAATVKERREQEMKDRYAREEEEYRKRYEKAEKERIANADDTIGALSACDSVSILSGEASMRHLVKREGREVFEIYGAVICAAFDARIEGREIDLPIPAEEKLFSSVQMPLRLKLTENALKKAEKLIKSIKNVADKINQDAAHRIWFYYALKWVREDKMLGLRSKWSEISGSVGKLKKIA